MTGQRIFDGHNDVLSCLWRMGDREGEGFFLGGDLRHIDRTRAVEGGLAGGFFAIWVPPPDASSHDLDDDDGQVAEEDEIDPVGYGFARGATLAQAELALKMNEREGFRICCTASEIEAAAEVGETAALLHLEGAEGIGPDLGELDTLYSIGLRSLGPVWSRSNIFAHGVPFKFGHTPDIGPGLTDDGVRLVRRCAELGVIVDLSHLNEAGFWDVAKLYDGPLVATHSNVHDLSPATRNLTGKQLDAIAERGGVVGLNFHTPFLRADGRRIADTPLETLIRHLDALITCLGEDGVALGSDFDGALMPKAIGDCEGLPALVGEMDRAGFGPELIGKICWDNWLGLIRRVIG